MKYKYLLFSLLFSGTIISTFAQSDKSSSPVGADEKGIIETLAKIEKKTDKFNLFFNMHGDFDADWHDAEFQGGRFQMKQFRIEMKGNINDWLSYRYRQKVHRGESPTGNIDNLWQSIDIAGIGLNFNKWSFFLGKQCTAYGGMEFDLNPIEIYQYSDMLEYMYCFLTGVDVTYNLSDTHQFRFQVTDAYNGTSEQMYGNYEKAKLPFVYTLNWNGNFNNIFKTRWSASVMNETKGEQMYYFALGNELNASSKFGASLDWMYSIEGVDRKGIITEIVEGNDWKKKTSKVDYMSFVLHLNYRFLTKWNLFFKGMYETAGIYKSHEGLSKGNYRTSYGYIGGVEYFPFKDRNLHFFTTYVGRNYKYASRAEMLGNRNYYTNRVSMGFIWHMPVF